MICFHCGRYGHLAENCAEKPLETVQNEETHDGMAVEAATDQPQKFKHGSWIMVQRTRRQRKKYGSNGDNSGYQKTNHE